MKAKSGIGYFDKNQWKCHNVNKRCVSDHYIYFLFFIFFMSCWCSVPVPPFMFLLQETTHSNFLSLQSSQGMRSGILMCSKVTLSSRFVFNNDNNKRVVCAE